MATVPLLYRKGCELALVPHAPTTWPESLIPYATLDDPAKGARAPTSGLFAPVHGVALMTPVLVRPSRPPGPRG
jgi:hypothetical protein